MVDAVTSNTCDSSSTLASPLDVAIRTISSRRCDAFTGTPSVSEPPGQPTTSTR